MIGYQDAVDEWGTDVTGVDLLRIPPHALIAAARLSHPVTCLLHTDDSQPSAARTGRHGEWRGRTSTKAWRSAAACLMTLHA
ncbi:hypothetical protein [Streptomyces sp. NPDC019539]|uniref:hypothetical protein n=1 Tax=Streptomyces sp. NPDC019539 TaxID=3365063 RepID=UPI0037BD38A9